MFPPILATAAVLPPCGRRRRRPDAAILLPVAVFVLLTTLHVTGADRKSRRKLTDDVITDAYNVTSMSPLERHLANATRSRVDDRQFEYVNPKPADLKIECNPLRSKRYITDGFCTSIKPVVDFVCTGTCLPIRQLPWYAEFIKVWSHTKTLQYRCVDDVVQHRKVTFACDNGETRSYRIRVVQSCKCKRYQRGQNESGGGGKKRKKKPRKNPPPPTTPPPPEDDVFDDDIDNDNEDLNW